jgi:hypothetical protein
MFLESGLNDTVAGQSPNTDLIGAEAADDENTFLHQHESGSPRIDYYLDA